MPVEKKGIKVKPGDEPEEEVEEEVSTSIPPATVGGNFEVTSPAGAKYELMNQLEVDLYNSIMHKYKNDNMFKNISDLLELDKVLNFELMSFRWSQWLLMEHDYDGEPVNVNDLQRKNREYAKAVLEIKTGLGLDKKSRDASNMSTAADFIENLKIRAKEMGIHRDEQNYMAYNLLRELEGKITLFGNATEVERTEFEAHASQILEWFRDEVIPKLDSIDEHFRENQKIWIREELN